MEMTDLTLTPDYGAWLQELKSRIQTAQQRASLAVNSELTTLYWQIGRDILERQKKAGWGTKVIDRLSADLKQSFPDLKGFSPRNLKYMRSFAEAWPEKEIVQEVLAQLPWYHHITLLDKLSSPAERLDYVKYALEYGWSRNVLVHHLESQYLQRQGKSTTNFNQVLPALSSDLAKESLKDPYLFDFLGLGPEASERDLEKALVENISHFLIELGAGFAYVGRQVHLEVGGEDFYLDLLFYHLKLRSYVVVELKTGDFKPEHAGQLNFYLSAVDAQLKNENDGPTIGLLLCKTRNKVVAEYALRGVTQPMGVSEYQLVHALPDNLKGSLPSIEDLERELGNGGDGNE